MAVSEPSAGEGPGRVCARTAGPRCLRGRRDPEALGLRQVLRGAPAL